MIDEIPVLPMPPRVAPDEGLLFTTGWTEENAAAVATILADHDPLHEGDKAIRDTPLGERLVVVAWTDGTPVAFLAGRWLVGTSIALCSYFRGMSQWHGRYRVGLALWSQWLALMRENQLTTVVIGIDGADPDPYRHRVERFVRLAGFTEYAAARGIRWYRLEVA